MGIVKHYGIVHRRFFFLWFIWSQIPVLRDDDHVRNDKKYMHMTLSRFNLHAQTHTHKHIQTYTETNHCLLVYTSFASSAEHKQKFIYKYKLVYAWALILTIPILLGKWTLHIYSYYESSVSVYFAHRQPAWIALTIITIPLSLHHILLKRGEGYE